ncbi:MAG TPA: formyltetrahydrofolate deformylase [Kofleriaceae bacterium]|nr:formyltetrahydrofolate deformylase [Kofleriaceae bacterium]
MPAKPRTKSQTWGDESVVSPLDVGAEPTARAPKKSSLLSSRSEGEMGTLMVGGPEKRGIHAALAQLLHEHGVHIVHSGQHTGGGMFFERIRFDLSQISTGREILDASIRAMCAKWGLDYRLYGDRKKRVAILVSKYEHCLYDLLVRYRSGDLPPCEISLIISNHPDATDCAEHFQIPFRHLPVTADTKQQQEQQIIGLLRAANIELIVLARYMQILSPAFVDRYPHRIINVHHSFLPAFIGANPYRQAYERGVKLIGATSHYVTSDLDQGPILEQEVIRCTHRDTVEDLTRKGRDLEKRVLAAAVRLHLEDRVMVNENKTVVFE